jgi:hypothetical protein
MRRLWSAISKVDRDKANALQRPVAGDAASAALTSSSNWPGAEVRALFARLYLGLSPETDAIVSTQFADRSGPLRPDLGRIEERLNCLRAVAIDEPAQK